MLLLKRVLYCKRQNASLWKVMLQTAVAAAQPRHSSSCPALSLIRQRIKTSSNSQSEYQNAPPKEEERASLLSL